MSSINTKKFAKQIKDDRPSLTECTVELLDSDGCLVMRVCDTTEDRNLVAEWDTGEDGHQDATLFYGIRDRLIDALNDVGIKASVYEYEDNDSLPPPSSMSVKSLLAELSALNMKLAELPGRLTKSQLNAVSEITNGNATAIANIRMLLGIEK